MPVGQRCRSSYRADRKNYRDCERRKKIPPEDKTEKREEEEEESLNSFKAFFVGPLKLIKTKPNWRAYTSSRTRKIREERLQIERRNLMMTLMKRGESREGDQETESCNAVSNIARAKVTGLIQTEVHSLS